MEQNQQIITWLKDAHALEQNLENNLQAHIAETRDQPEIEAQLKQHLDETRGHRHRVEAALSGLGASPSKIKTLAGGVMGMMEGVSTAVFADRQLKNIMADYAMEHFEIAFYRCLRVAANEAGLADIATMCEEILKEETAMAEWLEEQIPDMTRAHLQTQAASR